MMEKTSPPDYDSFAIFPALNIARLGNAKGYYVGSEIPGVYVGKGNPDFQFKMNGKIIPQAARFRIYGYKNDENLGEIDLSKYKGVTIKWTVVLANKKAANKAFEGMAQYNAKGPLRNADWPHDRSTLMAIQQQSLTFDGHGQPPSPKKFKPRVYRENIEDKDVNDGHQLKLGKMIVEKQGSLLIIGGKGESGSIKENAIITDYANNDYWYDDTCDGSIEATVTIAHDENCEPKVLQNREGKSWVLVAPPKYAPGIRNVVPLYQIILETQHPVDPDYPANDPVNYLNSDTREKRKENMKVNYYRDIYPIFEAVCRNSWVNEMGFRGHGTDKPGNFLNPNLEMKLSTPPSGQVDDYKHMRESVLSRVRIPSELASSFESNGQAYDYFMPPLSGIAGDVQASNPDTYLTVTRGQYLLLQKWARGEFEKGVKPQDYKYNYECDPDRREPTYGDDKIDFQDMVAKILGDASDQDKLVAQVQFLNKAPLEWSVGGAFFPGIEMTYLAYDRNTFHEYYDFRINSTNFQPGDINKYMALPWQGDFFECSKNWWPAQRPDIVIPKEVYEKTSEKRKIQSGDFVKWTRGFRDNEQSDNQPKWGDLDMVRVWYRLGFVVEKENILGNDKAFVEIEHAQIYGVDIQQADYKTLDDLYGLLKIALQVELSTIPPYLYALYSIKQNKTVGDLVSYKIRHVAAEEMLHSSLVANLMVAIGREPIFYSQEMMPFYPNPLPHFADGSLLVNLSKADVNTIETFIEIERPEPKPKQQEQLRRALKSIKLSESVQDINFESIATLYEKILELFQKLDGKIEYQTNFQLGPGMGYAPSTGADNERGLIVIKDLKSATDAINLIIEQGEGGILPPPLPLNNLIFTGTFTGETKAAINSGQFDINIKGKIQGTINDENKTIVGKIENGTIEGNIEDNLTVVGKIVGIFRGSKNDKVVEQIIEGNFVSNNIIGKKKADTTDDIFIATNVQTSLHGKINNAILEEDSHYNTFRMCKMFIENASAPEYQLWPVVDNPNVSSYNDPKIISTATAFNAAYSYLMLLLQSAWTVDGHKKRTFIIGGMPALMHGILRPIAIFLAQNPISTDTNAGATFGFYRFTRESSPKEQLDAAIQEASKAFPTSKELQSAANVVKTLPDISLPIF